eukprot:scaffold99342_cov22-Tisochrysis_lutea.AAC.2
MESLHGSPWQVCCRMHAATIMQGAHSDVSRMHAAMHAWLTLANVLQNARSNHHAGCTQQNACSHARTNAALMMHSCLHVHQHGML